MALYWPLVDVNAQCMPWWWSCSQYDQCDYVRLILNGRVCDPVFIECEMNDNDLSESVRSLTKT